MVYFRLGLVRVFFRGRLIRVGLGRKGGEVVLVDGVRVGEKEEEGKEGKELVVLLESSF